MTCLNKNGVSHLFINWGDTTIETDTINQSFPEKDDPFFDNLDYYHFRFSTHDSLKINDLTDIFTKEELDRVRNENVFLVCHNSHEGFMTIVDTLYKQIVIKHRINPEKLILLTNSQNIHEYAADVAKRYNKSMLQIKCINTCELMTSQSLHTIDKSKIEFPKIENIKTCFLNFNRRWRFHRPALVALMKIRNLVDEGHISLKQDIEEGSEWRKFLEQVEKTDLIRNEYLKQLYLENRKDILNISDLVLDTADFSSPIWYLTESTVNYYNETYFSIVSETFYYKNDENHSIFLTEKTFKPIAHKHPFIVVSTPHFLYRLKELGYQTFSPYIDESYDGEEDDDLRMIKIVNEIERLCNLSQERLKEFLAACEPICEYNHNLLSNRLDYRRSTKKYLY